jgi:L-iditol 2-dehydrogenase
MKAAVLYGNKNIRYDHWPTPETLPGTVKIKIRAAGICGSDIPRVFSNGAHFYPIVLGHEFSGDVIETGEGVTNVKPGDTVTGAPLIPCFKCADCNCGNYSLCKKYDFIGSRRQGAFAEYLVLPAENVVPYCSSISYIQAAMFEPSTVAIHGLRLNGFKGGGTVAVLGGGTIGIFTMQWAKIFGAKHITVFDINEERLELAKNLGADETICFQNYDFAKGQKFNYVFETAGQTSTMQAAFLAAGNKARVCFIGTPHADLLFSPAMWENMNRKEFILTGSWMSYSAPFPGEEWTLTAHEFATGRLKFDSGLVYRTYPLEKAAEAFSLFENPSRVSGKIILTN